MARNYDSAKLTLFFKNEIAKDSLINIKVFYMGFMIYTQETSEEGIKITEYFNPKSQEQQSILVTYMAGGTSPRSLIPCFDDPKYKATWDISVEHPSIVSALSNGRVLKEELSDNPGYSITTFETTHPMSSYLVSIAIGKFGYVSGVTNSGVSIKVWAPAGYEIYGDVAVLAAQDAINYVEKITNKGFSSNINKKLGKFFIRFVILFFLDIIAAPEYLGAMENWGAIIGKFSYVLFDPTVQTLEDKQKVYTVVAHEVRQKLTSDKTNFLDNSSMVRRFGFVFKLDWRFIKNELTVFVKISFR